MLKKIFISFYIICIIYLSGCTNTMAGYQSADIFAMDTFVTVIFDSNNSETKNVCENELERIENIFSKTIDSSDVARINSYSKCEISEECASVLQNCIEIAYNTDGAFNPAMGGIVNLWDISGKKHVPTEEEISSLLPFCDYNSIDLSGTTVTKETTSTFLDLGASVKGYAAERVINLLKDNNINNAMISIGGNVAVTGEAKGRNGFWRVAIRNPFSPDTTAGYIDCTDKVISVSGDYERYFENNGTIYHHIFDYKTGKPSDTDIKSVAVIAEDGLISDALSTALFCMGSEKALRFYNNGIYNFEAVIFKKDKSVLLTKGIYNDFVIDSSSNLFVIK